MAISYSQIYKHWSDEKLLNELQQIDEHGPEAAKALLAEIEKRNLKSSDSALPKSSSIVKETVQAEDLLRDKTQLEKDSSNALISRLDKGNGVILDESMSSSSRNLGTGCLFTLGGLGWIMILAFYLSGDWPGILPEICLITGVVTVILGIYNITLSRAKLKITKIGPDSISISIKYRKKDYELNSPLAFGCFATQTEHRVNGIKTGTYFSLYLKFIADDGSTVTITSNLPAGKSLPLGWDWVDFRSDIYQGDYGFHYGVNKKLKLTEIRTLLMPYLKNELPNFEIDA